MEYKIGQVFEVKGKWYQFVECNGTCCNNCVFCQGLKCMHPDIPMLCARFFRTDGKNGHIVLLDAIGDVYEQGGARWQQYKCIEKPNTEDRRVYIAHTDSDIGLIVSIRLTSSNDMENNEKHSNSEKIGKNLKPFDLQAAKSGKPVCTRDGRKARIICFDAKRKDKKSIIALVPSNDYPGFEDLIAYPNNGNYHGGHENDGDLMMLPEKKEGWVNVYRDEESKRVYCGESIFSEREKAEKHYECNDTKVATVSIGWEE